MTFDNELNSKYDALTTLLGSLGSVVVAFSGGVDSTFLLYAAHEALGDRAIAVTALSPLIPVREENSAADYCASLGVRQIVIHPDPLSADGFTDNTPDRCYLCKKHIFTQILDIASQEKKSAVAEGSNLDDDGDYRPGHRAITELGIRSPLRECGFTKSDIRILSRRYGLPTWDKPSYACLASRIPYGEVITEQKLMMIDRAEQILIDRGFGQLRVRLHGDLARIELVPEEMERFMEPQMRESIYEELKALGLVYITLDIKGYRTGSLNETLKV